MQPTRPDPILEPWPDLWSRATSPAAGFQRRAGQQPGLGAALRGLLLVRSLPALAGMVLGYLSLAGGYERIRQAQGPLWDTLWARLPDTVDPAAIRALLEGLPAAPAWWRVLPWLVPLAPLGILALWMHDAAWDHLALWCLRGGSRGLRATLVAEAEALKVGTFGALAGLLKHLGWPLAVLLWPVAVYFWILRGYALAAWHGCPAWKGVLATLLHAALMGLTVLVLVLAVAAVVLPELRVG